MPPHPQPDERSSDSGSVSSQHPYSRHAMQKIARDLCVAGDHAGRAGRCGGTDQPTAADAAVGAPPLDGQGAPSLLQVPQCGQPLPLDGDESIDGGDLPTSGQEQDAAKDRGPAAAEELQSAPTTDHDAETPSQHGAPPNLQQLLGIIAELRDKVTGLERQLSQNKGTLATEAQGERTADVASSQTGYIPLPGGAREEAGNGISSSPSRSAGVGAGGGGGGVHAGDRDNEVRNMLEMMQIREQDRFNHVTSILDTIFTADPRLKRRHFEGPLAKVKIRDAARRFLLRRRFLRRRAIAVVDSFLKRHTAALEAQTAWRCSSARRQYQRLRRAAVKTQTAWRGFVCRCLFVKQRCAAVKLQSAVRGALARVHDRMKALWGERRELSALLAQLLPATSVDARHEMLLNAAQAGQQLVTELLLAAGADGSKALLDVANNGQQPVARLLLAAGADGNKALLDAVKEGQLKAAEVLVASGVDGNKVLWAQFMAPQLRDIVGVLRGLQRLQPGDPLVTALEAWCLFYGCGDLPEDKQAARCLFEQVDAAVLHARAEEDNPHAAFLLGVMNYECLGVAQDQAAGAQLIARAAAQGHAPAQCSLGFCYESGQGVEKDLTKAIEWYSKAAEQGYAIAQCNLGFCYEHGQGVAKNLTKTIEWYSKAADQGYARAQCNLGVCYHNGQGVAKDLTKAAEWFTKAAEQGNATAKSNLRLLEQQ